MNKELILSYLRQQPAPVIKLTDPERGLFSVNESENVPWERVQQIMRENVPWGQVQQIMHRFAEIHCTPSNHGQWLTVSRRYSPYPHIILWFTYEGEPPHISKLLSEKQIVTEAERIIAEENLSRLPRPLEDSLGE